MRSALIRHAVPVTVHPHFRAPISQIIAGLAPAETTTVSPEGLVQSRAQGTPVLSPTTGPTGLTRTRALGALAVSPTVTTSGITHTRAQGSPAVRPTISPTGLARTRALGSQTLSPGIAPAGLTHTRAQGSPLVSPQALPSGLTRTRALGDPVVGLVVPETIPDVVYSGGTKGIVRAARRATPLPTKRGISQALYGLTPAPTLLPEGLAHTRALGSPTVTVPGTPEIIPDVIVAGGTKGVVRAARRATPLPKGVALPTAAIVAFPDPTTSLFPSGLTRTRAQGTPTVSPKAGPGGLTRTRALGTIVVSRAAVRQLGNLTVTVAWVGRPTGLERTRAQGTPTARGYQTLSPTGQEHTRAQGTPTLSARTLPLGIARDRLQGSPSVNPRTVTVASLTRTRVQGAPVLTVVWIARLDGSVHLRAVGSPTVVGLLTAGPPSLERTRAQGTPVLSGRALPASLTHDRTIGDPDVNPLVPASLSRV